MAPPSNWWLRVRCGTLSLWHLTNREWRGGGCSLNTGIQKLHCSRAGQIQANLPPLSEKPGEVWPGQRGCHLAMPSIHQQNCAQIKPQSLNLKLPFQPFQRVKEPIPLPVLKNQGLQSLKDRRVLRLSISCSEVWSSKIRWRQRPN